MEILKIYPDTYVNYCSIDTGRLNSKIRENISETFLTQSLKVYTADIDRKIGCLIGVVSFILLNILPHGAQALLRARGFVAIVFSLPA